MKIRPIAAEMFPAVGRTDMTQLPVASRYLANAHKNHRNKRGAHSDHIHCVSLILLSKQAYGGLTRPDTQVGLTLNVPN
jgi:hypothetical protein